MEATLHRGRSIALHPLQRLEARRYPTPAYALIDALQRAFAAVREKIAWRLDGEVDTPEQAARYAALLDQWRAVCGEATGAREHIAARLDRMAGRLHAASVTRTEHKAATINLLLPLLRLLPRILLGWEIHLRAVLVPVMGIVVPCR